jgi:hypothetical protein
MTATAHDYTWFTEDFSAEYCITLVRGLTPEEFLTRIGADVEPGSRDAEELESLCFDDEFEGGFHRLPIGATTVTGDGGHWALGVEWNGYAGVTEALIRPASVGTRIVSHFRNVNAVDHFQWYEDGELRLSFEPLFAHSRSGPDADTVTEQMRESGFDLRAGKDRSYALHTEACFALAERLTGVQLTADVLKEAEFLCGIARIAI